MKQNHFINYSVFKKGLYRMLEPPRHVKAMSLSLNWKNLLKMYFNIVIKYNFSLIHAHRSSGGWKSQYKNETAYCRCFVIYLKIIKLFINFKIILHVSIYYYIQMNNKLFLFCLYTFQIRWQKNNYTKKLQKKLYQHCEIKVQLNPYTSVKRRGREARKALFFSFISTCFIVFFLVFYS